MSDSPELAVATTKKKRPRRSGMFRRAIRRGLMAKVDPAGSERWVHKVVGNLRSIASTERSALGMQAVKILIEQSEDEVEAFEYVVEQSERKVDWVALDEKTDEELDTEIEQLDTEIKDLQQALGSVPTGNS